jgi:hypothetical protein
MTEDHPHAKLQQVFRLDGVRNGDDTLRKEARALLDQWRDSVRATLITFGAQESTAEDEASVLLAALEGALILSRASQSTQPLDTVQRFFTTWLTQAAANAAAPAHD